MPCRDYEDDFKSAVLSAAREHEHMEQRNRLARIACKALQELEANEIAEALLLRDDEVREWWTAHKEADRRAEEERQRKLEQKRKKRAALAKLTPEEKELLGLK